MHVVGFVGPVTAYLFFSITVAPPNLEVIMSYIILFDRQFVPLSGPNSRRTRTEHVQNEGCFFGEKRTCNCNAKPLRGSFSPHPLVIVAGGESSGTAGLGWWRRDLNWVLE